MLSLAVLVYTKHVLQGVYLLFSIIAILLFTACFFSNFKGYNFYTEMQYKPIGLLLSLLFSDYILIRFSQKNKNILVISIYVYTLLVLFAIGLDYNKYYNYVDSLVKTNKGNTMYFYNKKLKYEDIQMFLPLESTIINMYENSHCNFIGFRADTLTQKIGLIPDLSNDKKLCFKEPVVVKNAEIGMKEELELKFKWFINSNE